MEVFEIKRRKLHRSPSTTPPSGSKVSFIITMAVIILITGAILVISQFVLSYRDLSEILETLPANTAEHLVDDSCNDAEEGICTTEDCIYIASRMSTLMNLEADPCSDFYEYSCGGYAKHFTVPLGYNSYSPSKETHLKILQDIRKVVENPPSITGSSTLQKLNQIYLSCTNTTKRNLEHVETLKLWLADLDISFFEEQNEIATQLSATGYWRVIVSKLEEYHIHTVFQVSFQSTSTPIEKIILDCPLNSFQPDVFLEPNRENLYRLSVYKETMEGALSLLSMDSSKRLEFIEDVLQMETEIARAVQNTESFEKSSLSDEHVVQLKEIWRPLIGEAIHYSEVIDSCKNNLPGIISALNHAPPKMSAKYVLWKMLAQLVHYLGDDFRALQLHYTGSVPFWKQAFEKNWQRCAEFLRGEMGLASFKFLVDNGFVKSGQNDEIQNVFLKLKEDFSRLVRNIPNVDSLTKKLFRNKLQSMELDLGFSDLIHQPLVLDTVYSTLETTDNYFENVMNVKKFKTRYFLNRLWYANSEDPVSEISLSDSPIGVDSSYDYTKNKITMDITSFQFPMLSYFANIPKYLKFAETSILASLMAQGFDATGWLYDENGRWWNKRSLPTSLREKYDFYLECLLNQTSTSEYFFAEINDTTWINTIMADIGAFFVPYEGLSRYLKNETDDSILPSFSLDKKQLFYVQVAQKYCAVRMPEISLNAPEGFPFSSRSRVNLAVSNMKDFANIFNCQPQSRLNILNKCNLSV